MSMLARTYSAFLETVCNQFDCRDILPALQEGFRAYCEAAAGRRYRKPTLAELEDFVARSSEEEHLMRGDWETNRQNILAEDMEFIGDVNSGRYEAVTDGNGIIIYGTDAGRVYIYLLYVLPESRNRGIATGLVEYAKEAAGSMPVVLSVNSRNMPAISLYERLGFNEVHRFHYDGYDIIEMECNNSSPVAINRPLDI